MVSFISIIVLRFSYQEYGLLDYDNSSVICYKEYDLFDFDNSFVICYMEHG